MRCSRIPEKPEAARRRYQAGRPSEPSAVWCKRSRTLNTMVSETVQSSWLAVVLGSGLMLPGSDEVATKKLFRFSALRPVWL